jgi:hypothetical protein
MDYSGGVSEGSFCHSLSRHDNAKSDIIIHVVEVYLVVCQRLQEYILRRGHAGAAADYRLGAVSD